MEEFFFNFFFVRLVFWQNIRILKQKDSEIGRVIRCFSYGKFDFINFISVKRVGKKNTSEQFGPNILIS